MRAIFFMHYNFVRIRQTLKVTSAMAAGVTAKLCEMADLVRVLEDWTSPTEAAYPFGLFRPPIRTISRSYDSMTDCMVCRPSGPSDSASMRHSSIRRRQRLIFSLPSLIETSLLVPTAIGRLCLFT
jgi:hypothetical protein